MRFAKVVFFITFLSIISIKHFLYAGGLTQSNSLPAHTLVSLPNPEQAILGTWKFVGHIYNGKIIPPMNDRLILTFQFFPDKTEILKWYRLGEDGFCERKAKYEYDGEHITEQITWLNPKNAYECAKDPDMMLGRKTTSILKRVGERLHLELPLGDDVLVYIWERYTGSL